MHDKWNPAVETNPSIEESKVNAAHTCVFSVLCVGGMSTECL
jgi:hypothetical protein